MRPSAARHVRLRVVGHPPPSAAAGTRPYRRQAALLLGDAELTGIRLRDQGAVRPRQPKAPTERGGALALSDLRGNTGASDVVRWRAEAAAWPPPYRRRRYGPPAARALLAAAARPGRARHSTPTRG